MPNADREPQYAGLSHRQTGRKYDGSLFAQVDNKRIRMLSAREIIEFKSLVQGVIDKKR